MNISNIFATGVVLDTNVYVSGTLKLINGLISTDTDTIIVTATANLLPDIFLLHGKNIYYFHAVILLLKK